MLARKWFSLAVVLAFAGPLAVAQVPDGTVLVHAYGDVMQAVAFGDPAVKAAPPVLFSANFLAVYGGGKYHNLSACDTKTVDRFFETVNKARMDLYRDGSEFATGRLVLNFISPDFISPDAKGGPKPIMLTIEDIRPPITFALNALGATSDKLGSGKHQPRKVSKEERENWEALARSIMRATKKVPEAELKNVVREGVSFLNVNGKTPMIAGELVTKGADAVLHQLLLVAELKDSGLKPVLAQYNKSAGPMVAHKTLPFVDVLDVDGDGADEIVAILAYSGTRIFHQDGDRWAVVFTSGQAEPSCAIGK